MDGRINAHNTRFQVQMCLLVISTMINYFQGSRPPKNLNYGVNRHFKQILKKNQITISSKTMYRISTKFDRLMLVVAQRKDFVGGPI